MPVLSAFTPIGLLELSASDSDAKNIYATIKAQMAPAFKVDDTTYEGCEVYAIAMAIARARKMLERVPREMHPLTCFDLLTTNEKDWACVPTASDTLYQRQLRIAARKLLMRGSREEAIVTDLIAAIGSDFLKINALPAGDAVNFPATATDVGTFPNPNLAPKFYQTTTSVPVTGITYPLVLAAVNASDAPLVGEKITIEPDVVGNAEAVTVTAVSPGTAAGGPSPYTVFATFTKAHSVGAWVGTAMPLWLSNRYQLQVVITDAASKSAVKRSAANAVLARHCRTCERWKLVAASSASQVGPFVFGAGHNIFGATALGSSAVNF
ncbi:MAG TPA: hypothetical protein VGH28_13790 [Polyangiaceae bacterium]|jgi:hypothetical protein